MFIDFRERGREGEMGGERERERNIDQLPLDQGLNLQPRYVPRLGTKPTTFWCTEGRQGCDPWSHVARAYWLVFVCALTGD